MDVKFMQDSVIGDILIMFVDNSIVPSTTLKKIKTEPPIHTASSTAIDISHNKIVCISVVGM